MRISGTSSTPVQSSGSDSAELAKLQKQLLELTNQLRSVATGSDDPSTKQLKAKMLQAQIQMVQQQIIALQQKKAEASNTASKATQAATPKPPSQVPPSPGTTSTGRLLDELA